jgi:hypothetical protein
MAGAVLLLMKSGHGLGRHVILGRPLAELFRNISCANSSIRAAPEPCGAIPLAVRSRHNPDTSRCPPVTKADVAVNRFTRLGVRTAL